MTALAVVVCAWGCSDDDSGSVGQRDIYAFANGCFSVENTDGSEAVVRTGAGFELGEPAAAQPFFMKPSGLGRYLFFDDDAGYLVSDGQALLRERELLSDIETVDDSFQSEAEWDLQVAGGASGFLLRHHKTGRYLADCGLSDGVESALELELREADGCAVFPEQETHSTGEVAVTSFDDGALYGIADAHSHIFANFGFGGGGIFHGAPYHPLGVEHALPSCEQFHGSEGRKDLFGAGFDAGRDFDITDFVSAIVTGELPEFNHFTDGWPEFTTWPSAFDSSTHQTRSRPTAAIGPSGSAST
jgi:hypothetical protein